MDSLPMKISELKKNLMDINIVAIKKNKAKPIKINSDDQKYLYLQCEYNYLIKLKQRIKKYIRENEDEETILKMTEDRLKKITCIAVKIEKNKCDIGLPLEIKVLSGNDCSAFLNCTYYNNLYGGRLYLNDFRSSKPRQGYGSLILDNLDELILSINKAMIKLGYEEVVLLEGVMIANTNIISSEDLRKLYIKNNFEIDDKNHIRKFLTQETCKTL